MKNHKKENAFNFSTYHNLPPLPPFTEDRFYNILKELEKMLGKDGVEKVLKFEHITDTDMGAGS